MTIACIFCTKNEFLQRIIFYQTFNFDFKILYLLFNYSALTIRIIWIEFGIQKMNEYEYRIALFGPNYSNIRIIRIIRPNTVRDQRSVPGALWRLRSRGTGGWMSDPRVGSHSGRWRGPSPESWRRGSSWGPCCRRWPPAGGPGTPWGPPWPGWGQWTARTCHKSVVRVVSQSEILMASVSQ